MRLNKAKLTNGSELTFGDFNVFVGGNGVGKTTIISELFYKSSQIERNKYWWISDTTYVSDSLSTDMDVLKKSLSRKRDGFQLFFYSPATKGIDGNTDLADNVRFSQEEKNTLDSMSDLSIFDNPKYRRPFISFSSCESRLGLKNESSMVRHDNPPQDPINVLYRDKALLKEIDKNIFDIYKNHFTLLSHVGTALQIGISKELPPEFDPNADSLQDEFEKVENWKQEKFTPIEEAGHGMRSMVRLLTSLLDPVNQVMLIDEPEIHIYPSQKRWLGKQLVNLARDQKKQVFLVTHDPMILQGILDENTKTNIFRVDRNVEGNGVISVCELDNVDPMHSRNQDQYLQSLFYQRCVVVEGASDRSFYQQMFDKYNETQDKDLGVVVAGSVGHSKHVAGIAAKVGLKAAFIYDLDVLFQNQSLIKEIFGMLGGTGNPIEKLETAYEEEQTVKDAVEADKKSKLIKSITGYSSRSGFSDEWAKKHLEAISESLDNLSSVGIFVVPYGTLESWAPAVEEKVRFAERAPEVLTSDNALRRRFDDFAKKLLKYLEIDIP